MTKQEIIDKTNAFLTDRLEYEPSAITPDADRALERSTYRIA